jgi:hypothetical protein
VNLQDLKIEDLDFSKFQTVGIKKYFGHFSPTLRSIALLRPSGLPLQLLDFLRLFPKLDNIEIAYYHTTTAADNTLDTPRTPIHGSLRGKLVLIAFTEKELLEKIIAGFGGIRFISMDLDNVLGAQLLLDACAETLQTLRLHPSSLFQSRRWFSKRMTRHLS